MNNQAAQTMPELPNLPVGIASRLSQPQRDALAQYAMDYGRASYAAALSQTAGVADIGPGVRGDMARAWLAVTETLDQVFPQWIESDKTGRDCACDAIRFLAERSRIAAAPAASATSKTHDRCTDPENCKRCSEDASTPHAGIPHAAPAASGGEDLPFATTQMVVRALTHLGHSTPQSQEEQYARSNELVLTLCREVMATKEEPQPPAAALVSERARELLAAEYRTHGWHEDAGRLCMGGDPTSFVEDDALRVIDRLIEQGDEDAHVITELGRLLACIAVILKGPEPAGTAWSYHDLPELVASALSEPRQVAAEMKAWARTRMAEQQSSRRDRMMVSEWAKRLLPESSFPIKDFDVEGMSITKEAAREAVKRVALEQALTQQRGECEAVAWQVEWIDNAGDPTRYIAYCEEDADDKLGVLSDGEAATAKVIPLYTTPQPGAEALRELVQRILDWQPLTSINKADRLYQILVGAGLPFESVTDELESLLGRGA
jgi:hypothetical protein